MNNEQVTYIEQSQMIAIRAHEVLVLEKAKSEIRKGERKAYNADCTMGFEYAIGIIERMIEEVEK